MFYKLLKPLLFTVDAELAHNASLRILNRFHRLLPKTIIHQPTRVMGLEFPNPIGLAAGLDKNADFLSGLGKLGFGFIEIGTITPKPQPGNSRPRLFRVVPHRAIINRLGFNNKGIDYLLKQLSTVPHSRPYKLGINIGKNLTTPINQALSDYQYSFEAVYTQADYISINISSPNTPGLRQLQNEAALDSLLKGLNETRKRLQDKYQYNRPIALKISPDLDDKAIPGIADLLQKHNVNALIATNTTLDRKKIAGHVQATQTGGLSGQPLCEYSRHILQAFYQQLGDNIPIISVGGIDSPEEAQLRFTLGAKLVQIYSGLIYEGPGLIKRIAKNWE